MDTEDMDCTFQARELIAALQAEGMTATVEQMGGGTAALLIDNGPGCIEPLLIGPGSYDWTYPHLSSFTTEDLYYGPDTLTREGEPRDSDPPSWDIEPGTPLAGVARALAAKYRELNS
jgi:hypothetical protein